MKTKLFLTCAALIACIQAFATVHIVSVSDYLFSPASLIAHPGDTIMWKWANGVHTTSSTTIPDGAASWNNDINSTTPVFSYVPTLPGTYNYQCNIHAAMNMTGNIVVTLEAGVGTSGTAARFKVYPDPVSQRLHVSLHSPGTDVLVVITDMDGREILRQKFTPVSENDISTEHLPAGNYVVHAQQADSQYSEQIIVSH